MEIVKIINEFFLGCLDEANWGLFFAFFGIVALSTFCANNRASGQIIE